MTDTHPLETTSLFFYFPLPSMSTAVSSRIPHSRLRETSEPFLVINNVPYMAGACPLQVPGNFVWVTLSSPDVSPPNVPHERWMGSMCHGCAGHSEGLALSPGSFGPGALPSGQLWLKATRRRKVFTCYFFFPSPSSLSP